MKKVQEIWDKFNSKIGQVRTREELEKLRVEFLGRKGKVNQLIRNLPSLSLEERKQLGREINLLKKKIQRRIQKRFLELEKQLEANLLQATQLDVTLPGEPVSLGHLHPITQVKWLVADIFQRMGFEVLEPLELNTDYANFTSLNIPQDHPARDMWDTFWTREGFIPITHTSSMQNWIYRHKKPPIRVGVISRCFRNEATDASHEHTFYQMECVYVDRQVTVAHLIETMRVFFSTFYGRDLEIKVRPSYFPFVEPGLEAAIECTVCNRKGCYVCKGSGWIEILGCGQIHPRVLKEGGIDPRRYTGFAWGLGLDRLVMLYYGIEDIRHFHGGDLRFIKKF